MKGSGFASAISYASHGTDCHLGMGTELPGDQKEGHTSEECIAWYVIQNETNQPNPTFFDTFFSQFILDPISVPNQKAPLVVINDNTFISSLISLFKRPFYSQKIKFSKGPKYILHEKGRNVSTGRTSLLLVSSRRGGVYFDPYSGKWEGIHTLFTFPAVASQYSATVLQR